MDDRLTCILCPIGCELEVRRDGESLDVRGNECDKGLDFAADEVLRPKRNLATSIPARTEAGAVGTLPARSAAGAAGTFPARGTAARMISVRLSGGVPREMIFPILAEIAKLRPPLPLKRGQVLIANVLGTGVDVIATRTVDA
jgi:CxxC motif-containing protein